MPGYHRENVLPSKQSFNSLEGMLQHRFLSYKTHILLGKIFSQHSAHKRPQALAVAAGQNDAATVRTQAFRNHLQIPFSQILPIAIFIETNRIAATLRKPPNRFGVPSFGSIQAGYCE